MANAFDVMKAMSAANMDIRLAPLSNITHLQKTKHGTLITIGVEGDVVAAIGIEGRFVGGLILCDKEQYNKVGRELDEKERG